ncbi:MAG: hypothetical protein QXQ57_07670 [Sulfolobales archaeon]
MIGKEVVPRNDFIPIPLLASREVVDILTVTNVDLLYRGVLSLRSILTAMIEGKIRKLEPLAEIFEYNLEDHGSEDRG